MSRDGLIAALALIGLGVFMIVFRRWVGGLRRFILLSPPTLRGWGYWEKLIPNEAVAWRLEELWAALAGGLLVLLGLIGLVMTLLGIE